MRILYHLTILPPKMPKCEALSQEIDMLRDRFGGELIYLNPNQIFPLYVPRLLFGFHKLKQIRAWEADFHLHHLYNPDPFPFPILRRLRRPVIYSVSSGVGNRRLNAGFLASLAAVTVYDRRSLDVLVSRGLSNVFLVQPGINTARFTCSPLPLRSEVRLLVGSAPWTQAQYRTKGIDALLAAAQRSPNLRLVFLWRGVLADEMERRVRRFNVDQQVEVWDRPVNVNEVLASVHASISLATDPAIIKSHPHSLLESLAAGKPVVVSRSIPMADYVEQTGCGRVVEHVTPDEILVAIEALATEYESWQQIARLVGQRDFSKRAMLDSFQKVYESVLGLAN
jgi:glycosyltransferase involved in cell wall biosynthesis